MAYKPTYSYIPPAGAHMLTGLYDLFCFLCGLGKGFKRRILDTVVVPEHAVIADIGCGTGVFLEAVKSRYSDARVIGVDPDAQALTIADKRLRKQGFEVELINAFAESFPVPDDSVDVCFTTLALHHMPDESKRKAIEEMRRVLKPKGKIVITDFGKTDSRIIRQILFFEDPEYLESNFRGVIPLLLEESGFRAIRMAGRKFPEIHTVIAEK